MFSSLYVSKCFVYPTDESAYNTCPSLLTINESPLLIELLTYNANNSGIISLFACTSSGVKLSNKGTFDYIGLWEQLNNEVGYPSFTLSTKRWIERTNAIGIYSKGGKYSIGKFA